MWSPSKGKRAWNTALKYWGACFLEFLYLQLISSDKDESLGRNATVNGLWEWLIAASITGLSTDWEMKALDKW